MTTASGLFKQVAYKVEAIYGTVPVAAAAQALRRVTSTLELKKDTYQSNEIRTDFQVADFRHGTSRVTGAINGELSPGTYKDFFAACLKKDFVAGVSAAGLSVTVAGAGPTYTLTRATGSYITDGFKVGDVARITLGAFNAANLNKNLLVTALTATVMTVVVLNAVALVAEGPIATATIAVTGKKTLIPTTGHTDKSFSIEHFFSDVPASEVFDGCKVSKISVGLPPTGMATCAVEFMGQGITTSAAQYFTTPTAITSTGVLAAVNGVVQVNGTSVANVTGLSFDMASGQSGEPTVGSNQVAFLAAGRVIVTGQVVMTFDSTTYRDMFINETEFSIAAAFTTSNLAAADFVAFALNRCKISDASKSDGEKTLTMTMPFQALLYQGGSASLDATTIAVQDSQA